jgi:hypothetical protein
MHSWLSYCENGKKRKDFLIEWNFQKLMGSSVLWKCESYWSSFCFLIIDLRKNAIFNYSMTIRCNFWYAFVVITTVHLRLIVRNERYVCIRCPEKKEVSWPVGVMSGNKQNVSSWSSSNERDDKCQTIKRITVLPYSSISCKKNMLHLIVIIILIYLQQ